MDGVVDGGYRWVWVIWMGGQLWMGVGAGNMNGGGRCGIFFERRMG